MSMLLLEKFKQMQDSLRFHMNRTDELYEVALKINEKLSELEKPKHYISKEVQTMDYSFDALDHFSAKFNKAVLQNYRKTYIHNIEESDKCKKLDFTHYHMNTRQKLNTNKIKRPLITYPVFGRRKRRRFLQIKKLDSIHNTFDQVHELTFNNKEAIALNNARTLIPNYSTSLNETFHSNYEMDNEDLDKKSKHSISLPNLLKSHESYLMKQNATATISQNMVNDLFLKLDMKKSMDNSDFSSGNSIINDHLPKINNMTKTTKYDSLKQPNNFVSDSGSKTYIDELKKRGRAKFKNKIALFKNLNQRKMINLTRPETSLPDKNVIKKHFEILPYKNKLQFVANNSTNISNSNSNNLESSNAKSNKCYKCHLCNKIFGTSHGRLVHFSIMHKIGFGYTKNPYLIRDKPYKSTVIRKNNSFAPIIQSSAPPLSSIANDINDKLDPLNLDTTFNAMDT